MLAISIDLRILLVFTVVLTPVICKRFLVKSADDKLKEDKKYEGWVDVGCELLFSLFIVGFSLQPQQIKSQRGKLFAK